MHLNSGVSNMFYSAVQGSAEVWTYSCCRGYFLFAAPWIGALLVEWWYVFFSCVLLRFLMLMESG